MSNYTKSTNFTAKDSLPSGDTNKVVRGSEFDTEFDAIETAVATKADLAGPTFTGTTTIPTADINGGNIDGTTIGGSSAAAGTFTDLTASGTLNLSGLSVTFAQLDAGAVTLSSETFSDVDNQIPTNAAVIDYVAATIPSIAEVNDLSAVVTWANVPDANITESSVTQHQAALSVTASQISDVTSTAAELNLLDGSTANTVVNSKAVVYGSGGEIAATSYTGDGSALTGIESSPSFTATASGAIADGDPILINSNGTVSAVSGVIEAVGSAAEFESGITYSPRTAFDSNSNKVVFAYRDGSNSSYGTAVVGTVSGSSITFGTPVVFHSANTTNSVPVFDPDTNQVVIAFNDAADGIGEAIVGAVSGTSMTFGSPTMFDTQGVGATGMDACYDTTNDKVVIVYRDDPNNNNDGAAIVGTVSGTSISFGSSVVFDSTNGVEEPRCAFDANAGKVVVAYRDGFNATAIVGTVSGTGISFGSKVDIDTGNTNTKDVAYDPDTQKVVVLHSSSSITGVAASVGTVSGTSISFGTAAQVVSAGVSAENGGLTYDTFADKFVYAFLGASKGELVTFGVSGTDIVTVSSKFTFTSNNIYNADPVFDSNANKVVIAYRDVSDSEKGKAVVYTTGSTNLTDADQFVGFSNGAYADGSTATVQIIGSIDDAQSGLTAGTKYYVQIDGSLGTTAATPSVVAGTAISATKIIIKPSNA